MSPTMCTPLDLHGCRLQHRVVMAPMTRNRGVALPGADGVWLADDVVATYYGQRASPGGLLITEGMPVSRAAAGMPQVPGLFHPAQHAGWQAVVDAVHARGGFVYAQLWHAGRATIPHFTGGPGTHVSASSVPWDPPDATYPFRTPAGEKVRYADFPSTAMTDAHLAQTTADFVAAARAARALGFDGVEINGGNGNLLDQFLHTNLNRRTDQYGGSVANRCRFPLALIAAVADAVGPGRVAVRLEPTGLYQGTQGDARVATWRFLCAALAARYGQTKEGAAGGGGEGGGGGGVLSYVHFIEPRFDRIDATPETGAAFRRCWDGSSSSAAAAASEPATPISNEPFRAILAAAGIPCLACGGGWTTRDDVDRVLAAGWSAVAFARAFVSNPDLPARLRLGKPLAAADRSRFYGSWDGVRERGYVDYPTWEEEETARTKQADDGDEKKAVSDAA